MPKPLLFIGYNGGFQYGLHKRTSIVVALSRRVAPAPAVLASFGTPCGCRAPRTFPHRSSEGRKFALFVQRVAAAGCRGPGVG